MKKPMLFAGIILLSFSLFSARTDHNHRIPLIGNEAPSFKALSTDGEISFPEDFGNDWKIVFFHPRDFTPVCSSEILELAYEQNTFERMGTHLIVISTDSIESHRSWKSALEEINFQNRGQVKINIPLVADASYHISNSYGMIGSSSNIGQNVRGVFFVNPENKVSAFYFYPNEVGRSIDEIIRTLVALQTNYNNNDIVLPANWTSGKDVMLPFVEDGKKTLNTEAIVFIKSADYTYPDGSKMVKTEPDIYRAAWFMIYLRNSGL